MSSTEDDPRITAYALGEMDADARSAFEAELAQDPELQKQIEGIQATAGMLGSALKQENREPLRRLSADRRSRIQSEIRSARVAAARSDSAKMKIVRWGTSRKVVATAAVLACAVMLWIARSASPSPNQKVVAARELLQRVNAALIRYQADHHQLPPDTGFGFPCGDAARGAGIRYDSGALWRFLAQPSGSAGPYIKFSEAELVAYNDPVHGPSFCVVDPWGTPLGFVGDDRRVVHNRGGFDLFSAGPDGKTGQDLLASSLPTEINLAYDGVDNDGDGVPDNSGELGPARLNGCMTVANAKVPGSNFALDDINNWDR
jgi:hypothetical protein